MAAAGVRVAKEMGVTHREFFRILPRVFGAQPHAIEGRRIVVAGVGRRLEIHLSEEGERRLSPVVSMPVTRVELVFCGYSAAERSEFLARFEREFFKGGG